MPELKFEVDGAEPAPNAISPVLVLRVGIFNQDQEEAIHTIVLHCQIHIEAPRRRYNDSEQQRLADLFGVPSRWGKTLRPMLWSNVTVVVPAFTSTTRVDIQVPCTFDFCVATTKYFAGLEEGEVPLSLLFNGTVFYKARTGALQVAQIPWESEAKYRLPLRVWREMRNVFYPNSAWLCLRRDIFEQLVEHRMRCGIASYDEAIAQLIAASEQHATPGARASE